MSWMPCWFLDLMRMWERKGGLHSPIVNRVVHKTARSTVREKQLEWGSQTPSFVIKHTAAGAHAATVSDYRGVCQTTALIVGEHDNITPKEDAVQMYHCMPKAHGPYIIPSAAHAVFAEKNELVNALMTSFLVKKCGIKELTVEVETGGELRNFAARPKWALKNYSKWKATLEVGSMIGTKPPFGGICGCKVLRQDDTDHSPEVFETKRPNVGMIIDVSRETPPYITNFKKCKYTKLPTVAKLVPTLENVAEFTSVVDRFWDLDTNRSMDVAVHCHYGFNRTGFLVVSYLIESCGRSVPQAVAEYAASRPPGIKHKHFIDELYARYGTAADVNARTNDSA